MAQAVINQSVYSGDSRMPFMQHLKELRDRLMWSSIVVIVTTGIALIFGNKILELLKRPAGGTEFFVTELLENMSVWFKVSLTSGVIMAMPFLVYQLFAYVAPGLTSKEKRMVLTVLPGITFMFLAGVAFAYFVALPPAINFLVSFNSNVATPMIKIDNYIGIVTRMLLVIGLVFETPIIIMALARLGVVSPQWLAQRRRMWIVVAFVVAAIITPTFDPINQCIIAIPLILLLELGILLSRLVYKKRREAPLSKA
jgi:sec-independent protein translocase protein TatC